MKGHAREEPDLHSVVAMRSSTRRSKALPAPNGAQHFLPPEVWYMIGENIHSQSQLLKLAQTCHAFRDIFSPLAYANCLFKLHRFKPQEWDSSSFPSSLALVQDLEVRLEELHGEGGMLEGMYETGWVEKYALALIAVLERVKHLRSFRWRDESAEPNFAPALLLQDGGLIDLLKNCRSLENLFIQFAALIENDGAAMNCWMPLAGFTNLTSLELYNFRGRTHKNSRTNKSIKEIADLLCRSPNLKLLGLAVNTEFDHGEEDEVFEEPIMIFDFRINFLYELCTEYGSREQNPLSLHTLRLGHGIFILPRPSDNEDALARGYDKMNNYLTKLMDVSKLQKLHMFNGPVSPAAGFPEIEPLIEWRMLDVCTSLNQLSVTRLETGLLNWLRDNKHSIKEFLVSQRFQIDNEDLEGLLEIPIHFSMMVLLQNRSSSVFDEPDTDSDDGLSIRTETWTLLDLSRISNDSLERLSISLEFEDQWETFECQLGTCTRLTELRLNHRRPGAYPSKVSSLWPGVTKPKEIAYHYAQLAKIECGTLKFIRIGEWAWEFLPTVQITESSSGLTTLGELPAVSMRQLDWDEMMTIELFALRASPSEAGLPENEQWFEDLSDEDQERIDEFHFEMEKAGAYGNPGAVAECWTDILQQLRASRAQTGRS